MTTVGHNVEVENGPEDDGTLSTRERLLDAAIYLAGREGRASVTYRAVAGEVGVAHGLVRHYFGSRENLLAQALQRASRMDADLGHLAVDDIASFADGLVPSAEARPERPLLQFEVAIAAARGQGMLENVRRDYDHYVALTAQTLRRNDIDDPGGVVAAVVFAALDGLLLQHLIHRDVERSERALEVLREVVRRLPADRSS